MAGHSKWANIQHRKGRQDAKRGKLWTKIIREVTVAARAGGADPDANPRLRMAWDKANAANMPKDNIQRAIAKGVGGADGSNYDEIRYEGYGINGVAVIVEALTDNRNRTASEVRSIFAKNGGVLGETGSVGFLFERIGIIKFFRNNMSNDIFFDIAIEAGASDVYSDEEFHIAITDPDNFINSRDFLIEKLGDSVSAKLDWKAKNTVELSYEKAQTIIKMIDALEDCDDVQNVTANYVFTDNNGG